MSSPNSIKLYNKGINSFIIDVSGNVGINTTTPIPGTKLDCRGILYSHVLMVGDSNSITANSGDVSGNNQLLITPPTATNAASIQTVKQGTGYLHNLSLQPSAGNVGIGITNPNCKFEVAGKANIHNGSPSGAFMQSGSLIIGGINANYGGQYYTGGWGGINTAGLLLEYCV